MTSLMRSPKAQCEWKLQTACAVQQTPHVAQLCTTRIVHQILYVAQHHQFPSLAQLLIAAVFHCQLDVVGPVMMRVGLVVRAALRTLRLSGVG
jgi:hypothetical protein